MLTCGLCAGGASSPGGAGGGEEQEPFQDEVEQLLGDGEEAEEEEGEDLFGDNLERCVCVTHTHTPHTFLCLYPTDSYTSTSSYGPRES